MTMTVEELHNTVKAAVEELLEDTGAYTHMISIEWDGKRIDKVSTQMGSASKYIKKEDDGS